MSEYKPFGAEWELEMLKFKKQDLVEMLRASLKKNQERESIPMQAVVKPDACGQWQKTKPDKPCYFVHRYNRKDNNPSLFEALIDGDVLVVANIQDDEFVDTMDGFANGDFFIIEKY